MARFGKRYADIVARLRVPGGFLLAGMFAWLADPDMSSLVMGVPVSLSGLILRAWAAGHLRKNTSLATSGPYAWIRNPLYLGTLIVAAGLVIASRRWELAALFAAVFAFIYFPVIELEEQHLRTLFPEFEAYCRRVPMLLPSGRKTHGRVSFRFAQYWRNEEYNAGVGYLAGLALLLWKALR
jgi:protein-S-isoprenylcysteine O-methyltransferase Ste14